MRNAKPTGSEPDNVAPEHVVALTLNQTCERLQLSRPSVVGLIESGLLHAIKVGRKWLVSAASVDRFINGEASQ